MIATLAVAAARLGTLPRTPWHAHEIGFMQSLLTFDPIHQHSGPSGYPVFIALGRLVNFFVRDPFVSLLVLTTIASLVAALLLGKMAASLLGNAWCGAAVAVVVLLSPGFLAFGSLPNAESVTVALIAAAFFFLVERRPELFAVAAAAAVGARPQIAPAMLAVLVIGLVMMPRRGRSAVMFLASMVVVFGPVVETMGVAGVTHRLATLLPLGSTIFDPQTILRFVSHPWGTKSMALPLLLLAAAGAAMAVTRTRAVAVVALMAFGAIHTVTCIAIAPAGEGVRPVLPAIVTAAFFAVAALSRWPAVAAALAVAYAGSSVAYTWPVLTERTREDAPAAMAIRHAARTPSSIVVADPDLAPFAMLSPGLRVVTPDRADTPDVAAAAVQMMMHGRSSSGSARTFAWRRSDAYTKLTGEKYRVVSLVPQPPSSRYSGRRGVYAQESSPERAEWRWLSPDAEIELPDIGLASAELSLRLPDDVPIERNRIRVGQSTVELERGATVNVIVPASPSIAIRSERSFAPADRRSLAVQLVSVEQR